MSVQTPNYLQHQNGTTTGEKGVFQTFYTKQVRNAPPITNQELSTAKPALPHLHPSCWHRIYLLIVSYPDPRLSRGKGSGGHWALCWLCQVSSLSSEQANKIAQHQTTCKNGRGRPGQFYHMNQCLQRGEGVPNRKIKLEAFSCSFCPERWSFKCIAKYVLLIGDPSPLCLPRGTLTSFTKMDQAFPLHFCVLQAIKNWMVGRPKNKTNKSVC